ncbi:MAG: WcbI family polysaccharide biosynthesis putative acetyltransferase [Cyanobacteria bacterium P01_H01_bin.35]
MNLKKKKNIIIFGNCQAGQIKRTMKKLLPDTQFNIEYYSNNSRTEIMKSSSEILSAIGYADIFIYQPLGEKYKELSEKNLLNNIVKDSCKSLSFTYIFNSGVYSLCHAPFSGKNSYGTVYGEEEIIKLINNFNSKNEILQKYKHGEIDFRLIKRFEQCLGEMKRRELFTTIKLSEFIVEHYRHQKLFISHNHPSNIIFYEILRQIQNTVDIPFNLEEIREISELPETNSPISPYDVTIHDYRFKCHENWYLKGKELIDKIMASHSLNYTK